MKLIESVISTIQTLMLNQLPAELQIIEQSFADGVVLDPPIRIITYEPNIQEIPERPLLMILPGQSRFLTDTGYGGGGFADMEHLVLLAMLCEHADPYVLTRMLLRYQLAMVTVVGANRTGVLDSDGVSAWQGLSIQGTDPGERFQQGGMQTYTQVTMVSVKATRTEA